MALNFYPLGGQIINKKKLYFPTVDSVFVQAIHNGDEIAINLHWDDPSYDPALTVLSVVKESPPPPLPEHMRADEPEKAKPKIPEPQEFPDAIAVQFPTRLDTEGQKTVFPEWRPRAPGELMEMGVRPEQIVRDECHGVGAMGIARGRKPGDEFRIRL